MSVKMETGIWTQDGSDLLSQPVLNFLARRRIAISLVGFIGLSAVNLTWLRTVPLNPFQLNQPMAALGLVLMISGLAVRTWAAGTLNKSREVTDSGPYAMTRNPLYIGSFMMMIAFSIWLRDLPTFLFIVGPMTVLYRLQVSFEEKRLLFLFRDAWIDYTRRVPRFIPRRIPAEAFGGWTSFEWLRNREYRTVLACLTGMVAIYAWRLVSLHLAA